MGRQIKGLGGLVVSALTLWSTKWSTKLQAFSWGRGYPIWTRVENFFARRPRKKISGVEKKKISRQNFLSPATKIFISADESFRYQPATTFVSADGRMQLLGADVPPFRIRTCPSFGKGTSIPMYFLRNPRSGCRFFRTQEPGTDDRKGPDQRHVGTGTLGTSLSGSLVAGI